MRVLFFVSIVLYGIQLSAQHAQISGVCYDLYSNMPISGTMLSGEWANAVESNPQGSFKLEVIGVADAGCWFLDAEKEQFTPIFSANRFFKYSPEFQPEMKIYLAKNEALNTKFNTFFQLFYRHIEEQDNHKLQHDSQIRNFATILADKLATVAVGIYPKMYRNAIQLIENKQIQQAIIELDQAKINFFEEQLIDKRAALNKISELFFVDSLHIVDEFEQFIQINVLKVYLLSAQNQIEQAQTIFDSLLDKYPLNSLWLEYFRWNLSLGNNFDNNNINEETLTVYEKIVFYGLSVQKASQQNDWELGISFLNKLEEILNKYLPAADEKQQILATAHLHLLHFQDSSLVAEQSAFLEKLQINNANIQAHKYTEKINVLEYRLVQLKQLLQLGEHQQVLELISDYESNTITLNSVFDRYIANRKDALHSAALINLQKPEQAIVVLEIQQNRLENSKISKNEANLLSENYSEQVAIFLQDFRPKKAAELLQKADELTARFAFLLNDKHNTDRQVYSSIVAAFQSGDFEKVGQLLQGYEIENSDYAAPIFHILATIAELDMEWTKAADLRQKQAKMGSDFDKKLTKICLASYPESTNNEPSTEPLCLDIQINNKCTLHQQLLLYVAILKYQIKQDSYNEVFNTHSRMFAQLMQQPDLLRGIVLRAYLDFNLQLTEYLISKKQFEQAYEYLNLNLQYLQSQIASNNKMDMYLLARQYRLEAEFGLFATDWNLCAEKLKLSKNSLEIAALNFHAFYDEKSHLYLAMGTLQIKNREWDAAEHSFNEALNLQQKIPESLHQYIHIVYIIDQQAVLVLLKEETQNAIKLLQSKFSIIHKISLSQPEIAIFEEVKNYLTLIPLYLKIEDEENALAYSKKGIALLSSENLRFDSKMQLAALQMHLGNILAGQEKWTEAIKAHNEAMVKHQQVLESQPGDYERFIGQNLLYLAQAHFGLMLINQEKQTWDTGFEFAERAVAILTKYVDFEGFYQLHQTAAKLVKDYQYQRIY